MVDQSMLEIGGSVFGVLSQPTQTSKANAAAIFCKRHMHILFISVDVCFRRLTRIRYNLCVFKDVIFGSNPGLDMSGGRSPANCRPVSHGFCLSRGASPGYRRASLDDVGPSALASGAISHFSCRLQGRAEPP